MNKSDERLDLLVARNSARRLVHIQDLNPGSPASLDFDGRGKNF
jgi:hypothetical protein